MRFAATPCLTFNGQASLAIAFYESVFSMTRRVLFQGDDGRIEHAHLANGLFELMIWDDANVSSSTTSLELLVTFDAIDDITTCFERLRSDGDVLQPLDLQANPPLARVRDRFGTTFILEYSQAGREQIPSNGL